MVTRNTRKKSLIVFGLVLTVLLAVLGSVWLLLRHEPAFYRSAAPPNKDERRMKESASKFLNVVLQLGKSFTVEGEDNANISIDAEWINSFLKQEFLAGGEETKGLERQGISEPRVSFDKDRMLLGFRYRNFFMTTVITLEMRIWLVPSEINTFAIEILNRRAGALPFPTQALLEEISTTARRRKFEVNWYRHEGHQVALVRVQSNGPRPSAKFDRIELEPGKMTLSIVANELAGQAQNLPRPPAANASAGSEQARDRPAALPGFDPKMLRQQASPTPQE
jgi:hypothetical protein